MNKTHKLAAGIAVLFGIILIISVMISIATKQWRVLTLSFFTLGCLGLPFGISYVVTRKNIPLPSSFQWLTLCFIFMAQYLGEIQNFYLKFWWWDLLLHGIAGGYAVIFALYFSKGIIRKEKNTSDKRFNLFSLVFAFSFSMTLSTLWELFEFVGDFLVKSHMVKGGIEDTATDLLITLLTALITVILWYFRSQHKTTTT